MKPVFVCDGTCGAKISEEQYLGGLTTCGAEGCTKHGHEFTKMFECAVCGKLMKDNKPHPHE